MTPTDTKSETEDVCEGCLSEAELNEDRLCSICEGEDLNGANKIALQRIAVAADIDMARAKEVADIVCGKLKELTQAKALLERMADGVKAIRCLIENSEGVSGLHLNGDVAPWVSLQEGGQFETWLLAFNEAETALSDYAALTNGKEGK